MKAPKTLFGIPRSPQWSKVRKAWLKSHPNCEACGTKGEDVHHVKPYWKHPELECDNENLLTVCEKHCCHFMVGHLGNWKSWNPRVRRDAASMLKRINNRPKVNP